MGMPEHLGVVDLMIGFPRADADRQYDFLRGQLNDAESRDAAFPAEYLFKESPRRLDDVRDPVEVTLGQMDRYGIAVGMITAGDDIARRALAHHPDRFVGCLEVDPNDVTAAVRSIRTAVDELGIKAVGSFPAGCRPQVAIAARHYYPVYQTCIELDLPMVLNAGIAGPRVPSRCQDVMELEQVCDDFPELMIVMRHGAEPWADLAVELMRTWPGLHYMTSAFAPRYYPESVIEFANTDGGAKVLYAGYYPMGLSLERIFSELADVPLSDEVWPLFLRENAARLFGLGPGAGPPAPAASPAAGSGPAAPRLDGLAGHPRT